MLVDGRVADVQPYAELDLLVVVGSVLGNALLDCDGGIHRLVDAVEGDEEGSPAALRRKALMGREPRVDDIAAEQAEAEESASVVTADQAAVADHIGMQDHHQPARPTVRIHDSDGRR